MKITIQGKPEFRLPLTQDEVSIIRRVSEKHYDAVCRDASKEGYDPLGRNFLTSWRNVLNSYEMYPPDEDDFVVTVSATWCQIDTTLKILERCNLFVLDGPEQLVAHRISRDLLSALCEANKLYDEWRKEIDTDK